MRLRRVCCGIGTISAIVMADAWAQHDGLLTRDGTRLLPLGSYELPEDDEALKEMASAGINLVRCRGCEDLDRAHAAGLMGILPLDLRQGNSDELRAQVDSVADHPALAIWEGPDEVVWNFTAFSGLYKTMGVHKVKDEWWTQSPEALAYAEEQAGQIIPKMREAVAMIRGRDSHSRPVWINEALRSDLAYVRRYLDFVDITGCDTYPVKSYERPIARIGAATDRWMAVGRGKPVYMVLQAFSWHEGGESPVHKEPAYPTFAESRFMAYDALAHGARGILYWGSAFTKHDAFRQSIYAVTRELSALQPFLVASDVPEANLSVIEFEYEAPSPHVRMIARRAGPDWLLVLVNEDDEPRMAVAVEGLEDLNGRTLYRLYHPESVTVSGGELDVRLMPLEVRAYCTDRKYESSDLQGRDFGG